MTRGSQQSSGEAGKFDRLYGHERRLQAMRDAAPDMFEALTEFLAGADAGFVSVGVDQLARAALAKARGEQS
jgi:hypothetical protein